MAAKKANGPTYEQVVADVKNGRIKPVYALMGEEAYYIDRLTAELTDLLLRPDERDFNLITFFGPDADADRVINAARGFPMEAERLVVCVREAQKLDKIERLSLYVQHPQPTTVLILCYKYGTLDRRGKLASAIERVGVCFESAALRDYQMPAFVREYLKGKQLQADTKSISMLVDSVGTDLSRMAGELDKLSVALPAGTMLTPALIERHIGVSKEYNNFELLDAIVKKDIVKANRIAKYFYSNLKANPVQVTLSVLFKFFSNLLLAYYAPDKSERGIAAWLGVTEWQARNNYLPAMRVYTGVKAMAVVHEIRRADVRSKGGEGSGAGSSDLLSELLFYILH